MQTPLIFILAFVFVLALIALAAWLVRRFGGKGLGGAGNRGRAPRLAVIDATQVDSRRRLVLVRRDNVEHLLMIGGPGDIVVETNIVRGREAGTRDPSGRAAPDFGRAGDHNHDAEPAPVIAHVEPLQPDPSRAPRPAFADELRRTAAAPATAPAPAASADRRSDDLGNFVPEPILRPDASRAEPRSEPQPARSEPLVPRPPSRPLEAPPRMPMPRANVAPVIPPAAPVPPLAQAKPAAPSEFISEADQNLADMAQRLEAALRRPPEPAPRVAPEPRVTPEPRSSAPPVASPAAPAPNPAATPAPSIKTGFENLEDEMASLLGRPKTPS